jgi:HTH-type transcriptional regulator / antitoxin HigA
MKRVSKKYHSIGPISIRSESQYREYLAVLEDRMLVSSADPSEQEYTAMLVDRIHEYENIHYKIPDAPAHEVLKSLMEAHGETRKDLEKIFATRSAVSEALSGSRPFGRARIEQLATHYQVSPAVFYPTRPAQSKAAKRTRGMSPRPASTPHTWGAPKTAERQVRTSRSVK